MSSILIVAISFLSSVVHAQAPICKYGDKVVDRWGAERKTFDGVVTCVRENKRDGDTTEKHTYVKGQETEESTDGPIRKEIRRYYTGNTNGWLHGEQLEYYPKTSKLKGRKRYIKAQEVGLQEQFYESGKIKQKDFWVQDKPDTGGRQSASIGWRENGGVQFIRCSDSRETTIDAKLCGFDGKSNVDLIDETGKPKIHYVFEKGVKLESDAPTTANSNWAPALQQGTIHSADAARLKREKNGAGEKLTWAYEGGKIKRTSFVDEKGYFTGDDSEFFPSGKPARVSKFEKSKIVRSECWWENGKSKSKLERSGDNVTATFTWDTGVVESSAKYIVRKNAYNGDDSFNELAISCEMGSDGLEPDGHLESKQRDGNLSLVGDYKDGQPVGWQKQYDKFGKLSLEQLFTAGTRQKPGALLERKTYQEGSLLKHEKFNSDGSIRD